MKKKQLEESDVVALLREHDFKATPLRIALILALAESSKPLSVQQLARKTRKLNADIATIYRALEAFSLEEIVRPLTLTESGQVYELIREKNHEHHIVCMVCNAIESIPFCVRGIELNAQSKSKLFRNISSHTISFLGTCKKCARAVR